MITQEIRKDILAARKNGNRLIVTRLSTLLGEIQKKETNKAAELSDQEVSGIIISFVNNLTELMKNSSEDQIPVLEEEKNLYSSYLPKALSSEEISNYVQTYLQSGNDSKMGVLMNSLKKYAEDNDKILDGKMASEIVKRILNDKR